MAFALAQGSADLADEELARLLHEVRPMPPVCVRPIGMLHSHRRRCLIFLWE